MGYNNQKLQDVLNYCRSCQDLPLVEKVLAAAAASETKTMEIYCHSKKDAARKQRNLYKVLWFYPQYKQYISMTLHNQNLTIKIGQKIEKRGRKPK